MFRKVYCILVAGLVRVQITARYRPVLSVCLSVCLSLCTFVTPGSVCDKLLYHTVWETNLYRAGRVRWEDTITRRRTAIRQISHCRTSHDRHRSTCLLCAIVSNCYVLRCRLLDTDFASSRVCMTHWQPAGGWRTIMIMAVYRGWQIAMSKSCSQ